jgi:hypothetical protein
VALSPNPQEKEITQASIIMGHNILFLTGLVTRKEDQKDNFIFFLNYVNFKFPDLSLSFYFIF